MKTVFVGLSGGVDSAVSAALLKEQGHNVVGCFIKIWQPEFTECTWREDRLDAIRVCAALKIPYKEIDLSREYKDTVVNDMVENYRQGITPNPDVLCNRHIKFGSFASWAFKNGADMVATGHYAQVKKEKGRVSMFRGADKEKDQTYFLWQLGQADLERILFPIGGLTKKEVRAKASELNLPVADKHDSQGLCFVGAISLPEFLSRYITLSPGSVVDVSGRKIGMHSGAALYTVGQRHGFSHTSREPLYVVSVDVNQNVVTVSPSKEDATVRSALLSSINWTVDTPVSILTAQVRYREDPRPVHVAKMEESLHVTFEEPRIASKGQSVVLFDRDVVVGGGIIAGAHK